MKTCRPSKLKLQIEQTLYECGIAVPSWELIVKHVNIEVRAGVKAVEVRVTQAMWQNSSGKYITHTGYVCYLRRANSVRSPRHPLLTNYSPEGKLLNYDFTEHTQYDVEEFREGSLIE
jgi:hypothetical protein